MYEEIHPDTINLFNINIYRHFTGIFAARGANAYAYPDTHSPG
jgi:hypothetical protein